MSAGLIPKNSLIIDLSKDEDLDDH